MEHGDRETYRRLHNADDLIYERLTVGETDLHIAMRGSLPRHIALERLLEARVQLTEYIAKNPDFLTALEPLDVGGNAPDIVSEMCAAARKAGVGPMAAVAGAVASYVGMALRKTDIEVIVENGGDLYISSARERSVALYAGVSPLSGRLAVALPAGQWGVATSAGSFGHSLSFGRADAAMVVSHDAVLADAVATALGNRLHSAADMETALDWVCAICGILGAVCVIDGALGVKGDINLVPTIPISGS